MWIQITSGRGPAECQWVVAALAAALQREAQGLGVQVRTLDAAPGEQPGTLRSVLLALEGDAAAALLSGLQGTVQWVGRSPFRPHHKRRNWFVGVEALQAPEAPVFRASDLRIETLRASGPGGQHVNKTESAVRVTHAPSGLSVLAREERSQHQNRRLALARLAQLLDAEGQRRRDAADQARWDLHNELERGDAVRVYEGESFRRRG